MPLPPGPAKGTLPSNSDGREPFEIIAINRVRKLVFCNDGRMMSIVSFIDDDGDVVPEDEATYAVVKEHDKKWWRIRLSDYDPNRKVN